MSALADVAGSDGPAEIAAGLLARGYSDKTVLSYINHRYSPHWRERDLKRVRDTGRAGVAKRKNAAVIEPDGGGNQWQGKAREGSAKLRDAILDYLARRA